jgi:hypothetical protein
VFTGEQGTVVPAACVFQFALKRQLPRRL